MDYLSPVNPDMNMESVYHATNESKNGWLDILKTILPIGASLASDTINKEDYSEFARQQGFNVPEGMRIDKTQLNELFGERQHLRSDARMRDVDGGAGKPAKPMFEVIEKLVKDPTNPKSVPSLAKVPVQYVQNPDGTYGYVELRQVGQTPQVPVQTVLSPTEELKKQQGRFRN